MAGSSWRSEPAAELRGLAKICLPGRPLPLVERQEGGLGHVDLAAHLADLGHPAPRSCCGMSASVRTLAVTSSPSVPSPRVAPRTSAPPS